MITIEHIGDVTIVNQDDEAAGIVLDCYTRGWSKSNNPLPAIRYRNWIDIGYLSAMNGFDTDDAYHFIKRHF